MNAGAHIIVAAGSLIVLGLAGCAGNPSASAMQSCEYTDAEVAAIQQAAESGDADKQYDLGKMYYLGRCVPENEEIAAQWYRRAGEQSLAEAQFQLSLLYFSRRGVPHDSDEAWRWTHRAAMQGHRAATRRVCSLDTDKCRHLAENGNPAAQDRLAKMYHLGQGGLRKDRGQAVRWYAAATDGGEVEALSSLTALCSYIGLSREKCVSRWVEFETLAAEQREQAIAETERRAQQILYMEQRRADEARVQRLEAIQSRRGVVGLSILPTDFEAEMRRPESDRKGRAGAAVRGGLKGLVAGPAELGATGDSFALLGAAIGLVVGPFIYGKEALKEADRTSISAEEEKEAEAALEPLRAAVEQIPLEQGLQTALLDTGEELAGEPLFVHAPSTASTVVEARITGLGLVPLENNVRSSQFLLTAKANLIRTADGQTVDERFFCYGSTQSTFFPRWADDDAKLFREELEKAHTDIAEEVIAFLAGEEAEANTGPCATLQEQSDEEKGPRPDVR